MAGHMKEGVSQALEVFDVCVSTCGFPEMGVPPKLMVFKGR